jgi:hypothetical protein
VSQQQQQQQAGITGSGLFTNISAVAIPKFDE